MREAHTPTNTPDYQQLINCVSGNLRQVTRVVTQYYDHKLRPSGLLSTQFLLLGAIINIGETTISPLAGYLAMDRTTLTRNLKLLEKKHLIEITPGTDRRERIIRITSEGQAALDAAIPLWEEAHAHIMQGLGQDQWQQTQQALTEIMALTSTD